MRTFKKTFVRFFFVVLAMLLLVACGNKITEEDLQNLVFNDATFAYDGEIHSIYVENTYEEQGVEITYIGNSDAKLPGKYTVTAIIQYEEFKVQKRAVITITKMESVLTADTEQIVYLSNSLVNVEYSLNNDKQTVTIVDENKKAVENTEYSKVGTYKLELYAKGNTYYEESNHVFVTLKVVRSIFDIEYSNTTFIEDGTEKELTLIGNLPAGYTVEYKDNKGTEVGKYYATAEIKDSAGNVVETHKAVLNITPKDNEEFAKYLDEFFVKYLEGDQLSVNIICENPEAFGLEHYDATWYTYDAFDEEALQSDIEYFKELLVELKKFENADLSVLQQSAYETIEDFLEYNVEYYEIPDVYFMNLTYLDQFGGYIAEFGTYMEAYSLRTEQEVKDIVSYIQSTKTAFPSYVRYAQTKLEKGFGYSDFTLKEMRKYLEDILTEGENYYLKDVISAKIDAVTFLNDSQKEDYKAHVAKAIKEDFIGGVQELYDGLEQFLGKVAKEDEGYITKYENGKELFLLDLEKLLGIEDLDINEYIRQLDKTISGTVSDTIAAQKAIIDFYSITSWNQFENVINNNAIFKGTPEEMVAFLKEFAPTIVPELKSDPDIVIKEMDEASAKVSNAVAYYMKSALDNTGKEYITLNPVKLGSSTSNDVLGTLAHEGYPGHLYAYVYSKELGLSNVATVMTSTAHGEGWATYVELKLYEYAKQQSKDNKFKAIMDYLYANQLSGFLLETRLDVGIHYEGWDVNKVREYLDELGYNGDAAQELFDLLIETPTSYAAYGYGKLTFYSLHEKAKTTLGSFYDEVEFNAMLLSKGWTSLDILNETFEEYMQDKCYECGIEYVK